MLVDIEDLPVGSDVERPARRERLIDINHAVGFGDLFRGVAQERIVQAQRLRERLGRLRGIDTDREVGRVEGSDFRATLTE